MTPKLAGHLLVDCLIAQGATHVFGVPGESYLTVLDGLHDHTDAIRFINCRHEGGAAFMAEAHGKLTGRPGICFVTRGPGATNATAGLHTAFQDSTPMVLLVGDVGRDMRDREAFQEVDFAAFLGPGTKGLAKLVERIDDPNRIPEYVSRAFATALSGRPGPVVLTLPEDMLRETVTGQPLPRVEPPATGIADSVLEQLRARLLAAQRPLVIVGGSGWTTRSAQALQHFAQAWQLPVINAFRFQDTFDNHLPQYAGDLGLATNPRLADRLRQSDLLLVIGPRLGEMTTAGYTLIEAPMPRQSLLHIHASAEELQRVYRADLAIQASMASAALALETLDAPPAPIWTDWCRQANRDYLDYLQPAKLPGFDEHAPGMVDMPAVIESLQRHLPEDAVLTNGAGNFSGWLHRYFRYHGLAKGHKTQLAPTSGAMGYGVPAGIAAAIATGRVAFTIAGDGDFQMTCQELATAVQCGAKSIILVLDNSMYGTIRMHQERHYPNRISGTRLVNPDFCGLARAWGYAAERVTSAEAFDAAIARAVAADTGTLILLPISPEIITTRATLTSITQAALAQQQAKHEQTRS